MMVMVAARISDMLVLCAKWLTIRTIWKMIKAKWKMMSLNHLHCLRSSSHTYTYIQTYITHPPNLYNVYGIVVVPGVHLCCVVAFKIKGSTCRKSCCVILCHFPSYSFNLSHSTLLLESREHFVEVYCVQANWCFCTFGNNISWNRTQPPHKIYIREKWVKKSTHHNNWVHKMKFDFWRFSNDYNFRA